MAKKLTNKQKGYLAGAGALGLFLLYGGDAKAKTKGPKEPAGGGTTGGGSTTSTGGGTTGGGSSTSTTLKKGSSGQAVREWQRLLCAFFLQDLAGAYGLQKFEDGKFGDATFKATKTFQGEHNKNSSDQLVVDGKAGPLTRSSMKQYFDKGQDPGGLTYAQAKSKPCSSNG